MRLDLKASVRTTKEAARLLRTLMNEGDPLDRDKEQYWVVLLDARGLVTAVHLVHLGTVSQVLVHPREVFRPAVHAGAYAIIIGHNHPSGDPEPSEEDLDLHRRMVNCGRLMGIPVSDDIVITGDVHYSLMEDGE